MDETLIIDVWDIFKEYVPEKNRETAANQYVDFLVGRDVEADVLESMLGYDPHLDEAIKFVLDDAEAVDSGEDEDYDDEGY